MFVHFLRKREIAKFVRGEVVGMSAHCLRSLRWQKVSFVFIQRQVLDYFWDTKSPQFYNNVFIFVSLRFLGTLLNFNWIAH